MKEFTITSRFREAIITFNENELICNGLKDNDVININMKYTMYNPVLCDKEVWVPFTVKSAFSPILSKYLFRGCFYLESYYDGQDSLDLYNLYNRLLDLNIDKQQYLENYRRSLLNNVSLLFSDSLYSAISNFLNILDKKVILDIESFLSFKSNIFLIKDITADSFLEYLYNSFVISNEPPRWGLPIINNIFLII